MDFLSVFLMDMEGGRWVLNFILNFFNKSPSIFFNRFLAEFAMNTLGKELDSALKENIAAPNADVDNAIKHSLEKAFDQVEENFLLVAQKAYELGFSNPGKFQ